MTHTEHARGVEAALATYMARHPRGRPLDRPRRRGRTPEGRLLAAIVEALGREPDLCLWRNTVGVVAHYGRRIAYGLAVGSADLIGLVGPHGRFLALEVKAPGGRLTDTQARWLARVTAQGGVAAVVRSVADARAAVARAREAA